jgi:DNA-binding PadR family transcriptional regulator
MVGILSVSTGSGKHRGFIAIYLLHTLNKEPKSGYDILAEIREKCEGKWAPSKGTVYPLLTQLKDEGLIAVKTVGKRSKNIFELTPRGRTVLSKLKKEREGHREKMLQLRNLFSDVIGGEKAEVFNILHEIKQAALDKPARRKPETMRILKRCVNDLKGIK